MGKGKFGEMRGKELQSVFVETFEAAMKEKGFMRKGSMFHRIVNGEIVQLLNYFKFSGPRFTIQFLIWPLCKGHIYSTSTEGSRLFDVFRKDVPLWIYEYDTDGYTEQMPEALEKTKQHLFPLFDLIIDYQSYRDNEERCRMPLSPVVAQIGLYEVNMALGYYELCKEASEGYIAYKVNAHRKKWGTDYHISPSMQKEFERRCEEYDRMKIAMDNNDRECIEQYLCEKERKSLDSYVKAFTTPKKYEKYLETGTLPFEFVKISKTE